VAVQIGICVYGEISKIEREKREGEREKEREGEIEKKRECESERERESVCERERDREIFLVL
jgi:hypothetical protein